MSGYTEHYNLKKPTQSENYNVEDANTNNTIIDAILFGKVDKVAGKDLSSNDFTNEYKLKLDAMGKIYNYLGTVQNLDALGKIENSKKGDLYHVQSESADYAWNGTKWEKVDSNKGDTGVGITEITCQESTDDSGINVITIKLSDGRETSFNVRNGTKGKTGEKGDTGPRGETGSYPVLISTATGNPIHIEDSSDLEMKLKLKGGHKQETTKGKQLLNPADLIATITKNGLTLTNNGDGTFNISGTATANTTLSLWNGKDIYEAGHYFGLYSNVPYNTNTWNLSFAITYSDETATKYITPVIPVKATNENINTANVVLYIPSGTTINQTNVKIMLYKDDSVQATEYEPYTGGKPSPSPYYSQKIETVGSNVNLFDKTTITENQRLDPRGGNNYDENCDVSDYIKIQPNTTYTRNITASAYECICFYTINKTFISRDTTHATTTSPNNAYYVRMSCYKTNLDTLKLEKGTKATPYSPYGQGSVEVIKQNKNFLYYETQNQSISGINYTVNSDKSIQVSGTATAINDFYLIGSATNYESTNLLGNYKINGCNSGNTSKYILYVVKKSKYGTPAYYQNVLRR